MLLHTASMSLHTPSKICQLVVTYRRQDMPACRYIPLARFASMLLLHTAGKICQPVNASH